MQLVAERRLRKVYYTHESTVSCDKNSKISGQTGRADRNKYQERRHTDLFLANWDEITHASSLSATGKDGFPRGTVYQNVHVLAEYARTHDTHFLGFWQRTATRSRS